MEHFTIHPHLYKQPPSRSVKELKRKMEKLHSMSLLMPTKQQITSSLFEKDTTWMFWRGNWISRVHMYMLSWQNELLLHHIDTLTKIDVKIDKLPTLYWLPELHKNPYKSRFISNSSHCSTAILSKHITSALTSVKDHDIKYSETAFSKSDCQFFSHKNSSEVIRVLKYLHLAFSIKTLPRSSEFSSIFIWLFPLYTPHCHMIQSNQKCCLL